MYVEWYGYVFANNRHQNMCLQFCFKICIDVFEMEY